MESITLDEMKKYLEAKQRKKEYNRKYRLAHKEYYARKVREHRAKKKEQKSRTENASFTPPADPGQLN